MATDYLLAIFSCVFGLRLITGAKRHRENPKQSPRAMWGLGLIFVALGAFAGGTVHGFAELLPRRVLDALWNATVYSIGGTVFLFFAGTLFSLWQGGPRSRALMRLNALCLLAYLAVISFESKFTYVIAYYVPFLLVILACYAKDYLASKAQGSLWIVSGVLVSFVAAGIQLTKLSLHPHFNHNDLYHVVQILGLACYYQGAKSFLQGKRPGHSHSPRQELTESGL